MLNKADEYYEQFKTDKDAKRYSSADEYVATKLMSAGTSQKVYDWFANDAAPFLSTHSGEGQARQAAANASAQAEKAAHAGSGEYWKAFGAGAAEGAKGGGSIALNTFTFGGSDKLGVTNSDKYQGPDYAKARVAAVVSREAFITAGTLGVGQLASGGARGVSISARVVNTLAQSDKAVQAAKIVNTAVTVYGLKSGAEQTVEGAKQIAADPKNVSGYLNLGVGTVSTALGADGLSNEVTAANKAAAAAANVEKAVVKVEQTATKVEQAAAKVEQTAANAGQTATQVEQGAVSQATRTTAEGGSVRPAATAETTPPPTPAPATEAAQPPRPPEPAPPTRSRPRPRRRRRDGQPQSRPRRLPPGRPTHRQRGRPNRPRLRLLRQRRQRRRRARLLLPSLSSARAPAPEPARTGCRRSPSRPSRLRQGNQLFPRRKLPGRRRRTRPASPPNRPHPRPIARHVRDADRADAGPAGDAD